MSAGPTLIGLSYSPWSERARWALEARGVPYTKETYSPFLGELRLRRLRGAGRATVPVLVTDDAVLGDSRDIARWADARGAGPSLFPAGRDAEVAKFEALADRALAAGRVRALGRLLANDDGISEMVPPYLRWGGPASRATVRFVVRRTLRKYADQDPGDAHAALTAALEELRAAIPTTRDERGARPLLGTFSWADMTAAQALAFVTPPTTGLRVGAATRTSFADPELAGPFADVLGWRDELYAAWRAAPPRPGEGAGT